MARATKKQYKSPSMKTTMHATNKRVVIPNEIFAEVIDLVADGDNINQLLIHKTSPNYKAYFPSMMCFYTRIANTPELFERYKAAKKGRALAAIDTLDEIANDDSKDLYTDPVTGQLKVNSSNVQRAKLKTQNIQWLASALIPDTFGKRESLNVAINVNVADMYASALSRIQNVENSGDIIDGELAPTNTDNDT